MFTARPSRLSSNTVSAIVGAAAFAVLTTGTAVAVATSAVSITDATSGAKAHVTGKQSLVTSERDPANGVYARTDAAGKRLVGDGSGALSVDGAVNSHAAPAKPWALRTFKNLPETYYSMYVSYAVPGTSDLSVRTASTFIQVPQGQKVLAALSYFERDGTVVDVYVPLVLQFTSAGMDRFAGTLVADFYPRAGTEFSLYVLRTSATGTAAVEFTALGQLA
jgi:hypothetical protein